MISSKTHSQQQVAATASAYGGKTARACDSCVRKRARWYCAADDAFLCQSCDSSVHSANPLACRHERVRLKTASLKSLSLSSANKNNTTTTNGASLLQQPTWHRGFTRKARTPRPNGSSTNKTTSSAPSVSKSYNSNNIEETLMMRVPLVPEVGSDEHDEEAAAAEEEEEEHQLLYRVPIFDPLELCNSNESFNYHHNHTTVSASNGLSSGGGDDNSNHQESSLLQMQGLVLPSDMDLAEFAADVESLLGRGLENGSFGMEDLGILDCSNNNKNNHNKDDDVSKLVKMETGEFVDENHHHHHHQYHKGEVVMECGVDDSDKHPFQLSFEYGDYLPEEGAKCQEEEHDEIKMVRFTGLEEGEDSGGGGVDVNNGGGGGGGGSDEVGDNMDVGKKRKRNNILLRLDYEAVMAAWDTTTQGSTSPWTNGRWPDVNECWLDCMGGCVRECLQHHHQQQQSGYQGEGRSLAGDGGREARVSRYREKRRTRLFSKKIRYEVRKLNAEKRPRMKGRFVKRASFAATTSNSVPYTSLVHNKK